MRTLTVAIAALLILSGFRWASSEESKPQTSATQQFFDRLDTNGDGIITLDEAPNQGKMLVEFLLSQLGKKDSGQLDRAEFMRLTSHITEVSRKDKAVASALGVGDVKPAPDNCPACAMGLTAEFVFNRLDVDEDKLITVTEFMRSPGMQDKVKAGEAVGRIDTGGDGKLSWEELEVACIQSPPCKLPEA